jgi:hypothetical protein
MNGPKEQGTRQVRSGVRGREGKGTDKGGHLGRIGQGKAEQRVLLLVPTIFTYLPIKEEMTMIK